MNVDNYEGLNEGQRAKEDGWVRSEWRRRREGDGKRSSILKRIRER
jgi:hypothetical protein